eukprot:Selendium_serpulae@DN6403_c0_g1_i1.p2
MKTADFAVTPPARLDNLKSDVVQTWRINHGLQRSEGTGASCSSDFLCVFSSVTDKGKKKAASGAVHVGVLRLADQHAEPFIRHLVSHTGPVVDVKCSPFYDTFLATASHDNTVKLWQIPEDPTKKISWPIGTLSAHKPGVTTLAFNHVVDDVIITTGGDKKMKMWDLSVQQLIWSVKLLEGTNLNWSYDGNLISAVRRPCALTIMDARSAQSVYEVDELHPGSKSSKVVWIEAGPGMPGRLLSTGTSADEITREVSVWDVRNLSLPTTTTPIDTRAQATTPLHPHWDPQTQMVYLASRGDNNLIAYHIDPADNLEAKLLHKDRRKMVSFSFLPKRALNVKKNEIGRVFIQGGSGHITARSIYVTQPKHIEDSEHDSEFGVNHQTHLTVEEHQAHLSDAKSAQMFRSIKSAQIVEEFNKEYQDNDFADDDLEIKPLKTVPFDNEVYPPCPSGFPALTVDDWLEGHEADPHLWSVDPNKVRPMRTRNKIATQQKTFLRSFRSGRSKTYKSVKSADDEDSGGCCR